MGLPEIADFARNFAVMVRVHGPDPKGLKMRKHTFHQYNSGKTTLSASGVLLPETLYSADEAKLRFLGIDGGQEMILVVTVASVVESFLSLQHRGSSFQSLPELIPGAQIEVMLEDKLKLKEDGEGPWLSAKLLRLVDVPESSVAVKSLIEASSGPLDHGWEVGWSLASNDNKSQPFTDVHRAQSREGIGGFCNPDAIGKSATRIAILGVPVKLKGIPEVTISPSNRTGDFFLTVGSPFGVLSPLHFFNSVSVGMIANYYPPRTTNASLLMVDIRCLPGMEGGPVIGEHGHLIGILLRPLKQKNAGAEIQLVIPWEAIATACSDLLLKVPKKAEEGIRINEKNLNAVGIPYSQEPDGNCSYEHCISFSKSPIPVQKAISSVCLITIDEGVWASGIILNDQGLILTNAHLLEPWRFGKTTVNGGRNETKSGNDISTRYKFNSSYKGYRSIRVRLGHVAPWIWQDAKVLYVCKGPLDVALLQLEGDTDQLFPVSVDLAHPSLGSKAYVIGHGIFGPRCGIAPSVCSGVVANIVKAKTSISHQPLGRDSHIPAMLQTTAAVHPGGSGGAVVNSEGRMIGLVTSNARHGGGTVIPHLNFSIPCAVLAPIFDFSRDIEDFSLLQNLDRPNEHLSSIWALMPPLPREPNPSLPDLPILEDHKEGKGSKFAKFIAERDEVLKISGKLSKVERNSNEILSSKL